MRGSAVGTGRAVYPNVAAQAAELRASRRLVCAAPARIRGDVPVRATVPELLVGVALDLAIGDPRWLPHPVRGFGLLVVRLERLWRATHLPLKAAGGFFWLT